MTDRPDPEAVNAMQRGLMVLHCNRAAASVLRLVFRGWLPCFSMVPGWAVSYGRDGIHMRPRVRTVWVHVSAKQTEDGWLCVTEEIA